ncbi:bifunctional serine/threonine-protein kinase/formylglycine-generating enzyme family protein [Nannocystis radixulma]|uniref:Protein kinase n=1 Tax=Nannocystis radixulma TaxID=2995305 RepID=A0ABT5B1A3_9BACT|nr:bifunctional serine/threonine-protein kinase/formylglycine-generating enzyme family protein [Nannocystis radixulma]MDC0667880.1 protein kinase [Nannocystis radixulma]
MTGDEQFGETRDRHPEQAPELRNGQTIGRYVILARIGHGGMGVVYAAQDPDLDRRVALKFLRAGEGVGRDRSLRLLREAQSLAQLSHPNVVAVHDVGVLDERVWIAMEFLSGPNLGQWIQEKPRSWRDVLPVFLQAGAGLQAAHAAGFVHRDFKPENVMFGRDGRVRVVDFGLARTGDAKEADAQVASQPARDEESRLTMTGSLLGTPRYMAPEQWRGERADARCDQFSFCVSLWEALFGEPPFEGKTIGELVASVQGGRVKAPTSKSRAPGWLQATLIRGMRPNPADRWPAMEDLLSALQGHRARRTRTMLLGAGLLSACAVGFIAWQQNQAQVAAEIDSMVGAALERVEQGRSHLDELDAVRAKAFQAFDEGKASEGEKLWADYTHGLPALETLLVEASQKLEAALGLDSGRQDVRGHFAEVLLMRLLLAERAGQETSELLARLDLYDTDGQRRTRWFAPAILTVTTTPARARVILERYTDDRHGFRSTEELGQTPLEAHMLEQGSYRLKLEADEHVPVVVPVALERAERLDLVVALPRLDTVPAGFVYVPAGQFLYGASGSGEIRETMVAEPIHRVKTGSYVIGRNEVTYSEYLEFLAALSRSERENLRPTGQTFAEDVRLIALSDGRWRIELQPLAKLYAAESGAPLVYEGRTSRAQVEWERLPATSITFDEAQAYFQWLHRTGRVPGARFCNEYEWERAARGADGRRFSHGERLDPSEANIDRTYGLVPSAFGPDPVGSYPQTESPFGLLDTIGNAYELVVSPFKPDQLGARGGAFYYNAFAAQAANRFEISRDFRHSTVGFRVCADWPLVSHADE